MLSCWGFCNGLFCLETSKGCYVMNRATRDCKAIAKIPKLPDADGLAYSFGFDPKTEDCKLVRVKIPLPGMTCKADVFSLRNNSWSSKPASLLITLYIVTKN